MAEIIWSPAAIEDADAIAEYISRDSADIAALFISRLILAAERLCDFPYSGRMIPEIGNELCREIIYDPYRIMYRIEKESIWITGIVHGARDWRPQ
jgi:toxin ParE1/3/4